MKKLLTLGLVAFSMNLVAQNRIEVDEEVLPIDGNSRNSLTVLLEGADADEVKKEWKKRLKDMKGKVSDKTVIFADDCEDKTMGENTFDVYSVVEEITEGKVRLVVAIDLGGAYLNTGDHPEKASAAVKIVRDFAVEQAKNVVKSEIETNQKTLKGLEKDQSGLVKDKEKLEKDIQDYESKIKENKSSINSNVADQKSKQKEIHRLEESQLEGPLDEVAKVIKGYEKDLDGLMKDKKKMEKDNENLAEKIKEAKAEIEENLKAQANKKTEIEEMVTVIQNLEVKLSSIN